MKPCPVAAPLHNRIAQSQPANDGRVTSGWLLRTILQSQLGFWEAISQSAVWTCILSWTDLPTTAQCQRTRRSPASFRQPGKRWHVPVVNGMTPAGDASCQRNLWSANCLWMSS